MRFKKTPSRGIPWQTLVGGFMAILLTLWSGFVAYSDKLKFGGIINILVYILLLVGFCVASVCIHRMEKCKLFDEIEKTRKMISVHTKVIRGNHIIQDKNFIDIQAHINKHFLKADYTQNITDPESRLLALTEQFENMVLDLFDKQTGISVVTSLAYMIPSIDNKWKLIGGSINPPTNPCVFSFAVI